MKKKQFEAICRKLIHKLPGFVSEGWLLYADPIDHIVRGFSGDGSDFDPSKFTVTVFVLPLYVPTDHVYYNMGSRLKDDNGCERWWNVDEPNLDEKLLACIQQQGLPFLDRIREPSNVVDLVRELPGNKYPRSLEAIAYSLTMAGDFAAAKQAFERLINALDTNVSWQAEIMERAEQLARQLECNPQQAKQQLCESERDTLSNIGIGETMPRMGKRCQEP